MKEFENKFWNLADEEKSVVFCSQETEESDVISVIDINDPELRIREISNSIVGESFNFEDNFTERSQILYRKGYYLRLNPETEKNLNLLRDYASFSKR